MKKLEIVKTEARKIHIKKALLDLNFRYMNIISLVAFIAMVYGIIRNQNVISDDTAIINNLDYIIIPLLIWFVFTLIVYFTSGAHVSDMFSEVLEVNDETFVHSKNEAKGGGYMADIEGNVRVYDIVKFADIALMALVAVKTMRFSVKNNLLKWYFRYKNWSKKR